MEQFSHYITDHAPVIRGGVSTPAFADDDEMVEVDVFEYTRDVVDAFNYINEIRSKVGVPTLKLDPYLT